MTATGDSAAREEPRAPGRFSQTKAEGEGREAGGKGLRVRQGRRGAGRTPAVVLTAVSSRYTSGYWEDSMAGASRGSRGAWAPGADAGELAWLRGKARVPAGAVQAAEREGLSGGASKTGPAGHLGDVREAGSSCRECRSPSPAGGPSRGERKRSGRQSVRQAGSQLPLQERGAWDVPPGPTGPQRRQRLTATAAEPAAEPRPRDPCAEHRSSYACGAHHATPARFSPTPVPRPTRPNGKDYLLIGSPVFLFLRAKGLKWPSFYCL